MTLYQSDTSGGSSDVQSPTAKLLISDQLIGIPENCNGYEMFDQNRTRTRIPYDFCNLGKRSERVVEIGRST